MGSGFITTYYHEYQRQQRREKLEQRRDVYERRLTALPPGSPKISDYHRLLVDVLLELEASDKDE